MSVWSGLLRQGHRRGRAGPVGGYGLLLNFGSQSQSPIPPPNTVVAQQPDQGGGTENDNAPSGSVVSTITGSPLIDVWSEQMCITVVAAEADTRCRTCRRRWFPRSPCNRPGILAIASRSLSRIRPDPLRHRPVRRPRLDDVDLRRRPAQATAVIQAVDEALGQLLARRRLGLAWPCASTTTSHRSGRLPARPRFYNNRLWRRRAATWRFVIMPPVPGVELCFP